MAKRKKKRRAALPKTPGSRTIDLTNHTSTKIVIFANRMSRAASGFYRDRYGIGIVEWRVLLFLGHTTETTANRICRDLDLDKGAASRSLNVLARMGLISVKENHVDSRRRKIKLTAKGRTLHDRIVPVALERQRSLLAALSRAEVRKFEDMLSRLMTRVQGSERTPSGNLSASIPGTKI